MLASADAPSRAALRNLFVDCLCERDELDDYLSKSSRTKVKSNLNSPALEDYESVLLSHPGSVSEPPTVSQVSSGDESCVTSISDNVFELLCILLKTFGNDDWGWSQISHHYFPSISSQALRSAYHARLTSQQPLDHELEPKRWESSEDFIVISAFEQFGCTRRTLHEAFLQLGESRSLDEIKLRLDFIVFGETGSKRTKKAKNQSTSISTCPLPAPSREWWDIDDSLLQQSIIRHSG
jgi:hypothetical protein